MALIAEAATPCHQESGAKNSAIEPAYIIHVSRGVLKSCVNFY
jgi:hypothetical protein